MRATCDLGFRISGVKRTVFLRAHLAQAQLQACNTTDPSSRLGIKAPGSRRRYATEAKTGLLLDFLGAFLVHAHIHVHALHPAPRGGTRSQPVPIHTPWITQDRRGGRILWGATHITAFALRKWLGQQALRVKHGLLQPLAHLSDD